MYAISIPEGSFSGQCSPGLPPGSITHGYVLGDG
jgi:hypothetical protein